MRMHARKHRSSPVQPQRNDDDDGRRCGQDRNHQGSQCRRPSKNPQLRVVYSLNSLPKRRLPVVELDRPNTLQHLVDKLRPRPPVEQRNKRANVGGVSHYRGRNGAPSRKGRVVNGQTTNVSNTR